MSQFEEYKYFAEDAQRLSERRQNTSQILVTVNTAIFAVSALIVKDFGFRGWMLVLVMLPLFLTGVLLSVIWRRIILQHSLLIGWRYEQLRQMERNIAGSYQTYTKEWKEFFEPHQGKARLGFSALEVWLPRLFLVLYFAYGVGLVVAVATGHL